jgi:archaellum component FlaC
MKETKLVLAQKDIDEALALVEDMEKSLNEIHFSKENIKDNFTFLCSKLEEIEAILKEEGILE